MKTKFITKILALVMVLNTITIGNFKVADAAGVSDYVIQEIIDTDFDDKSKTLPFWKSEYVTEEGNGFISFIDINANSSSRNDFNKPVTGILEIKYDIFTDFNKENGINNYSINVAEAKGYSAVRLICIGDDGNFASANKGLSTKKLDNNKWYTILIRLDIPNKTMTVKYRLASSNDAYTDVDLYYINENGVGTRGTVYPYNGGDNKELPAEISNITISNKLEGAKAYMDNYKVTEYSEIPAFKDNIYTDSFDDGIVSPTASWDKVQSVSAQNPWQNQVASSKEYVTIDIDIYSGTNSSYTVSVNDTDIFSQSDGSIQNSGKYNPELYTLTASKWNKLKITLDKTNRTFKSFIADGSRYFEINNGTAIVGDSFNLSVKSANGEIYIDDVVINDISPLSIAFNQCIDINEAINILDYAYNYGILKFPISYTALNDSQKNVIANDMIGISPSSDVQLLLDSSIAEVISSATNNDFFVYDYDFTYSSDIISSLRLAVPGEVTSLKIDNATFNFTAKQNIITINDAVDLSAKEKINISAVIDGTEKNITATCGGFKAENTDLNYYPNWTRKAITFSLDDGNITQDAKALAYLNNAGIKGTFNLIGSSVEKSNPEELKQLYNGHEIGNHGYHHIRAIPYGAVEGEYIHNETDGFYYKGTTPYLDVQGFNASMDKGRDVIEEIFGEDSVKTFAWPFGRGAAGKNQDIIDKAMADYNNLRHAISLEISKSKYFSHPTDLSDWESYKEWNVSTLDTDLVSKYKAFRDLPDDGKLKFFAVGMHSSDYNKNNTWSAMESFCTDMGNRPDLYWYATNTEIIDYGAEVKNISLENKSITNNSPYDLYFVTEGKKSFAPANSDLKLALSFGDDISGCDMTFSSEFDTIADAYNMSGDLIHGYGDKKLSEINYNVSKGASVKIYAPDGSEITDKEIKAYPGIMYRCISGDNKYTKTYTLGYPDICIYAPFVDIEGEGEDKTLNVSLQMRAFLPSGKTYTAYAASYFDGELIALNKGEVTIPETLNSYKTYTMEKFSVNAAGADSYKVMVFDEKLNPVIKNSYADTSLNNKKILFLGDSITGISDAGYPKYIGSLFGADVYNGGISGTTLAKGDGELYEYFSLANLADMLTGKISTDTMAKIDTWSASYLDNVGKDHYNNTLKTVSLSDMEYLSIFYGTNDFNRLTPIDNAENDVDVKTAKGALRYAIESFKSINPDLKIIVFTPLYRDRMLTVDGIRDGKNSDYYPNSDGVYLKEYCEAIEEVCAKYDIPCYNLYELSGINKLNSKYYLNDGLHPSEPYGRNYLGQLIGQCIADAY